MNAMAQAGMQVFAQAKAQPASKAAKTVQKKASQVTKTARKTVRWAPAAHCRAYHSMCQITKYARSQAKGDSGVAQHAARGALGGPLPGCQPTCACPAGSAPAGGRSLPTARLPGMARTGRPSWAPLPPRPRTSRGSTLVPPPHPPLSLVTPRQALRGSAHPAPAVGEACVQTCGVLAVLITGVWVQATTGGTPRACPPTRRRLRATARSRSSTLAGRCWARSAASRRSCCSTTAPPACVTRPTPALLSQATLCAGCFLGSAKLCGIHRASR